MGLRLFGVILVVTRQCFSWGLHVKLRGRFANLPSACTHKITRISMLILTSGRERVQGGLSFFQHYLLYFADYRITLWVYSLCKWVSLPWNSACRVVLLIAQSTSSTVHVKVCFCFSQVRLDTFSAYPSHTSDQVQQRQLSFPTLRHIAFAFARKSHRRKSETIQKRQESMQ